MTLIRNAPCSGCGATHPFECRCGRLRKQFEIPAEFFNRHKIRALRKEIVKYEQKIAKFKQEMQITQDLLDGAKRELDALDPNWREQ